MSVKLTVEVIDEDEEQAAQVLEHIAKQLRDGFTSGFDRKENGRFAWGLLSD